MQSINRNIEYCIPQLWFNFSLTAYRAGSESSGLCVVWRNAVLLNFEAALVVILKLAIYRLNMIPHQNKNDADIVW